MSNLTVSYVSQTPAGIVPAGAASAAPDTDNPLGFLAALIDRLLPGTDTDADALATSSTAIPGLLDVLDDTTEPAPDTDLIAAIAAQLDQLQARLGDGVNPAGNLDRLRSSVDALTASLDGTKSPGDIAALRDRLLALGQSLAATAPDLSRQLDGLAIKLEADADADADATTIAHIVRALLGHDDANAAATPPLGDDLLKLLASLGTAAPPAAGATAATTTDAVSPDLVRLSNQLSQIGSALAQTAPGLAQKLDALATRLVSAGADPALLTQLQGAAAQSDGTALDSLIRNLVDARPVTTPAASAPQIAAPAGLTLPAPIAPTPSKSAAIEVTAAQPQTAPVAADSAPDPRQPTLAVTSAEQRPDDASVTPETKAAPVMADGKSEPANPPAPQPLPPAATAQPARQLPAAYQPVANPINMGQMAFEMVRQVQQGTSRFTIRLDPPEMGRVDVRMHVDAAGTVNARLTVDRAETLDLFQRDRQALERALTQAGFDASRTNLEFSLRQNNHNPFAGMMNGEQQQPGHGAPARAARNDSADSAVPAITLYRGTASAGGVNIFA